MMASVAANVSWNPRSNRLKGLAARRMKALSEMVLMRWTSFQRSFPVRKQRVMMTALKTDGLPSTSRA